MIRFQKRPRPVSGKSAIIYFFVSATNESSLSNSALNKSESFQDVVSDPETSDPPTKRLKQRAIGFESSWKQDFTCLTEVEGSKYIFTLLNILYKYVVKATQNEIASE